MKNFYQNSTPPKNAVIYARFSCIKLTTSPVTAMTVPSKKKKLAEAGVRVISVTENILTKMSSAKQSLRTA